MDVDCFGGDEVIITPVRQHLTKNTTYPFRKRRPSYKRLSLKYVFDRIFNTVCLESDFTKTQLKFLLSKIQYSRFSDCTFVD